MPGKISCLMRGLLRFNYPPKYNNKLQENQYIVGKRFKNLRGIGYWFNGLKNKDSALQIVFFYHIRHIRAQ